MKLQFTTTCIFAIFSALISQSATAPTQALSTVEKRAPVTGPVIFLSNCFETNGKSHGEFDYYADASTSVLNGGSSAPTLTNIINPTTAVDYIDGGTFTTVGPVQQFIAIFSIDENDFAGPGSRVGNGKSTSWFWAQVCFEMNSATVYSPKASETCTSSIYCMQGPADPTDL